MQYSQLRAFALATPRKGYQNQLIGALKAIAGLCDEEYDFTNSFLLPEDIISVTEMQETVFYAKFADYEAFYEKISTMLDVFMKKVIFPPRIFITVYDTTEASGAKNGVDMLCRAVKEYYAAKQFGRVLTAVINSALCKYKYVDLIHVPKHLLTLNSRIRMLKYPGLRKKVLCTKGTIHSFKFGIVKERCAAFLKQLPELRKDKNLTQQLDKLDYFMKAAKKVVVCLGGRTESRNIIMDVAYAKSLWHNLETLYKAGYGVVIVNGPRTPNDVTDYLYEKSFTHPHILFQNSKPIAIGAQQRQNWRIYSGSHEKELNKLKPLGNIYPAVLGFDNTLVVHTADSYSGCETTTVGIPTAISRKGIYIHPKERYDCINLYKILCPQYAVDFDEFVQDACRKNLQPDDLHKILLPNSQQVFAESVINRLYQMER